MLQNGRLNLDVTWHRRTQTSACTAPAYTRSRGYTHVTVTPGRAGPSRATRSKEHRLHIVRGISRARNDETAAAAVADRKSVKPFCGGDTRFFFYRILSLNNFRAYGDVMHETTAHESHLLPID